MSTSQRDDSGPVGALLCGGASRRMGREKALLDLEGRPLFAWASNALGWAADRVQSGGAGLPGLDWPVLPDSPTGAGPAAGIATLLEAFPGRIVACCAVDMPFAGARLLRYLADRAFHLDDAAHIAVVPFHDGRWHPLAAAWCPAAAVPLRARLDRGLRDLQGLLTGSDAVAVTTADLAAFGDPDTLLANINTPEQLAWAREIARQV